MDYGRPKPPAPPDFVQMNRKLDAILAECQWIRSLLKAEVKDESYQPTPENTLL